MLSSQSVSAIACVALGLGCIGEALRGDGDPGAAVAAKAAVAVAAVAPPARGPAAAEVDTGLPTGSIEPISGLRAPNPAAYADAAKDGSSLILTGAEAINYLTGNTLRREGPGEPLHFTYFASRGLSGDGLERGFTARRWDRERQDLCETARDGSSICRPISILLDAKAELQGGRLGTVTFGGPGPARTAVLIKGDVVNFPGHIPFLDGGVDVAARPVLDGGVAAKPSTDMASGGDGLAGHLAAVSGEPASRGRQIVYYARDNRRLELQPVEGMDGGRAVQVTVGRWRDAKGTICETRVLGDAAQACFKFEPLAGGLARLAPTGKAGAALSLTILPETGVREVARD